MYAVNMVGEILHLLSFQAEGKTISHLLIVLVGTQCFSVFTPL